MGQTTGLFELVGNCFEPIGDATRIVDPISIGDIRELVRELKSRDIGVLITDHNVRETLGVCSRAYIVNQGTVIASGSAEEILANPQVREVYLGESFRL